MKRILTLAALLCLTVCAQAKIWRINNMAGITADFTNINAAMNASSVVPGDTLHVEPSIISYNGGDIIKRIVIIGGGYLLDPANAGNGGMQASINQSVVGSLFLYAAASGSKIMGIVTTSYVYMWEDSANNISLEKCYLSGVVSNGKNCRNFNIRKSIITGSPGYLSTGSLTSATIENTLITSYFDCTAFATGCVIRNCVFDQSSGVINNCYFANNICGSNLSIANSIVKNNFFYNSPTMPAGAVNNHFNVPLSDLCKLTGSYDGRYQLKAGSAAIGAGVTIAAYTPDCGAFGGPDPYHLSGIPSVPSIYQLSVPASIQLNTPTMNVTISTRNNN